MYHLNEDGKWDDRGTGHVSIDYVEVRFVILIELNSILLALILLVNVGACGVMGILYVLQRSEELSLCVIDEEDNETLLVHPINTEDIYRKQEGRLWVLSAFDIFGISVFFF